MRAHLVDTLSRDPECVVVGEAADGDVAIRLCQSLRPDVVTLDMMLLGDKTGVAVTESIMAYCPTPILIVSSSFNRGEIVRTFAALAAGAIDVIEKPSGYEEKGVWEQGFVERVKLVARIKVITHPRLRLRSRSSEHRVRTAPLSSQSQVLKSRSPRPELIAIGASTGGPGAVVEILRHAPQAPVLLVIHVGKPFGSCLSDWLAGAVTIPVSEAVDGQALPPPGTAHVLIAPADRHIVIQGRRLRLSTGPERNSCRPSVDVLFESVAEQLGSRSVGCLLTGMGRDGAQGLLRMRDSGAITIAQDQASCVVFGMPQEAIRLGAATQVLPLAEIGPTLVELVRTT